MTGATGGAAVEVSPVRPDEVAVVGDLLVAGYLDVDPAMRGRPGYIAQLRDVASRAADPDRTVLVARVDGRPVGSATVVFEGAHPQEEMRATDALLRMLAVDPAAQGRGAGRALLRGALAVARDRGRRRMLLYTQPQMRAAHRLYESAGFVRVSARDWCTPDGVPLLAYELDGLRELDGQNGPSGPGEPSPDPPRSRPADTTKGRPGTRRTAPRGSC